MEIKILCYKIKKKIIRYLFENEMDYYLEVKFEAKKIGEGVRVMGPSIVNKKTIIGSNTAINRLNIIGTGECIIGAYCHLAFGLTIITSNHNYKGNGIPYDNENIEKTVKIEDFVWIGANVTVLPGVTIGEGAIIQAGSVIRNSIPPLGIAGGNPAIVFSSRDEEHYYKLKKEKKYY